MTDEVIFRVSRHDIEEHAGRPVTDDELVLIVKALELVELDSVVAEVVYAVCSRRDDHVE